MSNYAINLAFLETYARENGYALSPRQLASMARRFTRWEVRNVFCHKNGYEDFRDQVICLDYDELLEMYVEETVHPAVRPPWQSPGNYAYFQSEVMGKNLRSTKRRAIEAPPASQRYYKKTTKPQIHYQDNRQKVAKASTTTPVTFLQQSPRKRKSVRTFGKIAYNHASFTPL